MALSPITSLRDSAKSLRGLKIPLKESLDIIEDRLKEAIAFSEIDSLPHKGVMELSRCCLQDFYFDGECFKVSFMPKLMVNR